MDSDSLSFDEASRTFESESKKLEDVINSLLEKSEKFSIPEIVNNYFQIMTVNSHISLLKKHLENEPSKNETIQQRIQEIEQMILQKFNKDLHLKMMSQLQSSITELTNSLQNSSSEQNSKQSIQNQAKLYDELREMMSTKEFVEQYDKGLTDD